MKLSRERPVCFLKIDVVTVWAVFSGLRETINLSLAVGISLFPKQDTYSPLTHVSLSPAPLAMTQPNCQTEFKKMCFYFCKCLRIFFSSGHNYSLSP